MSGFFRTVATVTTVPFVGLALFGPATGVWQVVSLALAVVVVVSVAGWLVL